MEKCSICGLEEEIWKKIEYKHYNAIKIICKKCHNGQKLKYKKQKFNKEPFKTKLILVRSRAKSNNIPFDLTEEYLASIWTGICPVLNIDLEFNFELIKDFKSINNFAELDRINPKLGYIKGNVAWISARANRLKQDATLEEIENIFNYVKNWKEPEQKKDIENILLGGLTLSERKNIINEKPQHWMLEIGESAKINMKRKKNIKNLFTNEEIKNIREEAKKCNYDIVFLSKKYNLSITSTRDIINNKTYFDEFYEKPPQVRKNRFSAKEIEEIRKKYNGEYGQMAQLAREYGISRGNISDILNNKKYRNVITKHSNLSREEIILIKKEYDGKHGSITNLAKKYNCTKTIIGKIVKNKIYTEIK